MYPSTQLRPVTYQNIYVQKTPVFTLNLKQHLTLSYTNNVEPQHLMQSVTDKALPGVNKSWHDKIHFTQLKQFLVCLFFDNIIFVSTDVDDAARTNREITQWSN